MVTDLQVRRLFDMQNKHEYLYQAADKAGISSKTAHKYLKNGKLPRQSTVKSCTGNPTNRKGYSTSG